MTHIHIKSYAHPIPEFWQEVSHYCKLAIIVSLFLYGSYEFWRGL